MYLIPGSADKAVSQFVDYTKHFLALYTLSFQLNAEWLWGRRGFDMIHLFCMKDDDQDDHDHDRLYALLYALLPVVCLCVLCLSIYHTIFA